MRPSGFNFWYLCALVTLIAGPGIGFFAVLKIIRDKSVYIVFREKQSNDLAGKKEINPIPFFISLVAFLLGAGITWIFIPSGATFANVGRSECGFLVGVGFFSVAYFIMKMVSQKK